MWSVPLAPRNLQALFIFISAFEHLHLWFDIPSQCMHSAILLQYGMHLMLLFSSLLTQTLLSHFLKHVPKHKYDFINKNQLQVRSIKFNLIELTQLLEKASQRPATVIHILVRFPKSLEMLA